MDHIAIPKITIFALTNDLKHAFNRSIKNLLKLYRYQTITYVITGVHIMKCKF